MRRATRRAQKTRHPRLYALATHSAVLSLEFCGVRASRGDARGAIGCACARRFPRRERVCAGARVETRVSAGGPSIDVRSQRGDERRVGRLRLQISTIARPAVDDPTFEGVERRLGERSVMQTDGERVSERGVDLARREDTRRRRQEKLKRRGAEFVRLTLHAGENVTQKGSARASGGVVDGIGALCGDERRPRDFVKPGEEGMRAGERREVFNQGRKPSRDVRGGGGGDDGTGEVHEAQEGLHVARIGGGHSVAELERERVSHRL